MKFIRTLTALFALLPSIAFAQNAGTVTNNAFAIGKGPGTAGYRSVLCTAAQLPVGQAAAPICRTITGDVTIDTNGVTAIGANKVTNSQLATAADGTIKSNISGGVTAPIDNTISAVLDKLLGTTRGAIAYRGVSTWTALAPGTSGFALKSNGPGADPSYQAAGSGTVTSVTCGLGLSGGAITGAGTCAFGTGTVIGSAFATYATNASLAANIPADDTPPLSGEGTQIISFAYTPRSAASTLRVKFNGQGSCDTVNNFIAAIFNGGASALAAQNVNITVISNLAAVALEGSYAPGTTAAQTLSVRVGCNTGNAAMNGFPGGRRMGGVSVATLSVDEIAP